MPEVKGLVSVIIPAYNAAGVILETIDSVFAQQSPDFEIILVNDGSTDNTSAIVRSHYGERITILDQENSGVSVARNNGLKLATGEFVVFLDADDLLTPSFIKLRADRLRGDESIGFVGGWIQGFPSASFSKKAAASDPVDEILFFRPGFATVPSNYLIRKRVMLENGITFNPLLSSTADRFFILQLAGFAKGACLDDSAGKLLYRISETSMSHRITPSLLFDNELFYRELKKNKMIPSGLKRRFKAVYFFSLAGGFSKIRYYGRCVRYLTLSFFQDPFFLLKRIFNYKQSVG